MTWLQLQDNSLVNLNYVWHVDVEKVRTGRCLVRLCTAGEDTWYRSIECASEEEALSVIERIAAAIEAGGGKVWRIR